MTGRTAEPERPAVAVVVPSHDRPGRLAALLDSLSRQTLDAASFEVIVAHDSSGPETEGLLVSHELAAKGALRHLTFSPGPGPAEKRNAGWRATRAPLVVFTDDDCKADRRWLEALVAEHERQPEAVIQGRTEPDPAEVGRISAFAHSVEIKGPTHLFETCNVAYPRELLARLGGFDEAYGVLGGEDVDLGWRATKSGASHSFCEAALVYHAVELPGAFGLARKARRWKGAAAVVAAHPEVRRSLAWRVFWDPSHKQFLLALLGVLFARPTRGLALALVLPYVASYRGVHGSAVGTVASLPGHALVDGASLCSTVNGAIRSRTFVL